MSYSVKVIIDPSQSIGIKSVTIKSNEVNKTLSSGEWSVSGLTENVTFSFTLDDAYEFVHWERIGNVISGVVGGGQQIAYVTIQTYTYTDGVDIQITPITVKKYALIREDLGTIPPGFSTNVELDYDNRPHEVYHGSLKFTNSGTATFYTTGNSDPYGGLTDTEDWNESKGQPDSYIKKNDDSGDGYNFKFTCDVVAGTTYYIWIIDSSQENDVDCTLHIDPPTASSADLTPTNLTTSRGNRGLTFTWGGASDATSFIAKLTRKYDGYLHQKTVTGKTVSFTGLECGVTYSITIQGKNSTSSGDESFGYNITTAPSRPTITNVSQNNGVITGSWRLVDGGNITHVYLALYDSSGTSLGDNYNIRYDDVTSGNFEFPAVENGVYEIRASSVFHLNNGVIWSVKDGGDDGSSNNGDYKYIYPYRITVASIVRPGNWIWSNGVMKSNGTYYFDGKEIHPVTATEWNNFTTAINSFRDYAAQQGWVVEADPTTGEISYTFTPVGRGLEFTSAIYNEAAKALYGIAKDGVRCCRDVSIKPGTELSPSLFAVFETEIAKIP